MISKKENPLINIAANVVIPVFVLKKLSTWSPLWALIIALAFPVAYGAWSFVSEKRINPISVLGILNTLFTGGFVLFQLDGIWFAVKEAGFPLLIGIFVMISSFSEKPFIKMILFDSGALNTALIHEKITEFGKQIDLKKLLQKTTFYFSLTFYLSALLNFLLAWRIFTDIPMTLSEAERNIMLNDQVAEMTWMGYVVIFVPSLILFIALMYYFFSRLTKLTGLKLDHLVKA